MRSREATVTNAPRWLIIWTLLCCQRFFYNVLLDAIIISKTTGHMIHYSVEALHPLEFLPTIEIIKDDDDMTIVDPHYIRNNRDNKPAYRVLWPALGRYIPFGVSIVLQGWLGTFDFADTSVELYCPAVLAEGKN